MSRSRSIRRAVTLLTSLVLVGGAPIVHAAPNDGGGGGTGDVFADLLVILRNVDGVPILKEFEVPSEVEGETVVEYCVQPISPVPLPDKPTGPIEGIVNPSDGRTVYPIPLMGDPDAPAPAEGEEVEVCDPWTTYAVYVAEAELERLNMARQPDAVFERKLNDVMTKVLAADEITLDGAGRITLDGVAIDAAPEHAAVYRSLLTTGSLPGLAAQPAEVAPFDTWMLAAASIAVASGKEVPITIDSVQYYNRIATVIPDEYVTSGTWDVDFLSNAPADPEQFVDFGGFSYTRSDVFQGCATWLDVDTLTWQVSPIMDLADFAPLPPVAVDGTVDNIAGFAQLADDIREVIVFLHENSVIPGFYLDPVGENTCTDQLDALSAPAVDWDAVPEDIIQTDLVRMSGTAYLPWEGTAVANAQLRITLDAPTDFTDPNQVTAVDPATTDPVAFDLDAGNLVGLWPVAPFALEPGDTKMVDLDVTIAAGAPTGDVTVTLELVDLDAGDPVTEVLATDTAITTVHEAALTALWTSMFDYVAQGVTEPVTARVFNPDLGQEPVPGATLRMTVDAPADFLLDSQVSIFADAVQMPLSLVDGDLVGTWTLPDPLPVPFDESITWFVNIGEGSPTGIYQIGLEVLDASSAVLSGPALGEFIVGYEAGAPVVTITEGPPSITNSRSATFAFESSVATTRFECLLDEGAWEPCTSPVTVDGLTDGAHSFAVATTLGGTAVREWTVDTVAPGLELLTRPAVVTNSRTATFGFSATDASTVLCSIDGAPLEACSTPTTYDELVVGRHQFLLVAFDAAGNHTSRSHAWEVAPVASEPPVFSVLWPARLADTRPDRVAADGGFVGKGPVRGGSMVEIPVAGRAGVPEESVAVVANVTVADAEANGYATVYPCGERPGTSSINYQPGRNVANEVMAQLSGDGSLCVYVHSTANVIVDVVGYVPDGIEYQPVEPTRVEDSRPGPVVGGSVLEIPVAGRAGVPDDAVAVVANVTVADAEANGYATVYPCGERPGTSSINYQPGRNVANEVIAELSGDGSLCVYVHSTANVIVDVVGYVPDGIDYQTLTPVRLEDSRPGPVVGGSVLEIPVAGRAGVPDDAVAVVANVTVADAEANGYATVFPCGDRPPTSSVNYQPGRNIANEVVAALSADGSLCVYVHSTANVIVDVVGYY